MVQDANIFSHHTATSLLHSWVTGSAQLYIVHADMPIYNLNLKYSNHLIFAFSISLLGSPSSSSHNLGYLNFLATNQLPCITHIFKISWSCSSILVCQHKKPCRSKTIPKKSIFFTIIMASWPTCTRRGSTCISCSYLLDSKKKLTIESSNLISMAFASY